GGAKRARRGYSFDEVAIAPSRRTRDTEVVSTSWRIDAYTFDSPLIAAPMDSIVSPASAIELARQGVLPVLNLEGLWSRYEDPEPLLAEISGLDPEKVTPRLQEIYARPIDHGLAVARIAEMKAAGITVAVAASPQATAELAPMAAKAGADLVVIRGTTVSAEHVSGEGSPLNLKQFIYELDVPVIVGGCATYQAALHLMRTGAAGVLVGFGGGASLTTSDVLGVRVPMASAVAEVAAARRDYLDESGGRYVHVIADGSMSRSGDIVRAFACGADAAMLGTVLARATDAPGRGTHWGPEAWHPHLPRGSRNVIGSVGTFREVLHGPSNRSDGSMNVVGALRKAMATTGYSDLKEFQRVEVVVTS
ncbi:MAG: GuaB3 family IMP dehydrogenase-related protein, partial [Candidatus Nanopelagicales bacterium]|nr:GuaB3 family IMP dehydrogenase-related protein [Candidatus Nanopelagicales bacterium]